MVDGGPWDNATINDTLHFITPYSDEVLLMTGYFPSPTAAGILIVFRGIEGLKDIAALGNLSTESPTVLTFATSGYTNCQRTDIGKPVKRNGNPLQLTVLIAYDNNVRKWWLSRPHDINTGDVLTIDGGQGVGTRDSQDLMNKGGGAIMIGRSYERSDDPPRVCLTNGDTLYITAGSSKDMPNGADDVLANLKVKDLTATGNLAVDGNLTVDGTLNMSAVGAAFSLWNLILNGDGTSGSSLMSSGGSMSAAANEAITSGAADYPQLLIDAPNATIRLDEDCNLYRAVKDEAVVLETDNGFVAPAIDADQLVINQDSHFVGPLENTQHPKNQRQRRFKRASFNLTGSKQRTHMDNIKLNS